MDIVAMVCSTPHPRRPRIVVGRRNMNTLVAAGTGANPRLLLRTARWLAGCGKDATSPSGWVCSFVLWVRCPRSLLLFHGRLGHDARKRTFKVTALGRREQQPVKPDGDGGPEPDHHARLISRCPVRCAGGGEQSNFKALL